MKGAEMRVSLTLVVSGDSLDPDEITKVLGIKPHSSKRKGDIQNFASGKSVTAKIGLWEWRSRSSSFALSLNQHADALAKVFLPKVDSLHVLPHAENVWIDVHLVAEVKADEHSSISFMLDSTASSAFSKLGLPVEITVDALSPG